MYHYYIAIGHKNIDWFLTQSQEFREYYKLFCGGAQNSSNYFAQDGRPDLQ